MKLTLNLIPALLISITLVHASPIPGVPAHAANGVTGVASSAAAPITQDVACATSAKCITTATQVTSVVPDTDSDLHVHCKTHPSDVKCKSITSTTQDLASPAGHVASSFVTTVTQGVTGTGSAVSDTDLHVHCKAHPNDVKCKSITSTTQDLASPAGHVASTSESEVHTKECPKAADSSALCDEVKVHNREVQPLVDEEFEDVEGFVY